MPSPGSHIIHQVPSFQCPECIFSLVLFCPNLVLSMFTLTLTSAEQHIIPINKHYNHVISGSHNLPSQLGGINISRTRCSILRRSSTQDLLIYWPILRHKATLGLCKSVCCLYQMFSIKTFLFLGLVIRAMLLSYHVYRISGPCCATTLW